ncbi:hemerythrin domain-containing protein [Polyangium aurulentum]|uniref:hemerythrin domain-containing protein n=1 Tax=Polyangium aurulentum TaxID=2567896 RepID=UPI0010AE80EB|nr:hemerythrin domain-containing protein [Polyangium aurulentum]UQA61473.1 hemerythrin domain-containing protein [Polyangium aurulentum]
MKATDLLKNQHREVEELFRQLEGAEDESARTALRLELANNLAAHAAIEEEIFYPATMEALESNGRIREGLEEHALAEFALYRLMQVSPMDETFSAKVSALKELVKHHVEEEESEILPQAESAMGERLEMLGERLEMRFMEKMSEGAESILAQNLGIIARGGVVTQEALQAEQAQQSENAGAAKKTSRRPAQKRASGTKRGGASKRGAAGKTAAAKRGGQKTAAKRGTAKRGAAASTQSKRGASASTSQKKPARGQGVSRGGQGKSTSGRAANNGNGGAQRGGSRKRAPR